MELIIIWSLIFIISVCALIKASDWLVLGLRRVVPLFGMRESDIALPAALIAVALPEMGVALAAALEGKAEVAIAVVIGSSIANILLVTGLAAFSAGPLLLKKEYTQIDLPLFISSVAVFFLAAFDGRINAFEGVLMILMFFVYIAYSSRPRHGVTAHDMITPELIGSASSVRVLQILPTRLEKKLEKIAAANGRSLWKAGIWIFGGALLLFVAASFLTMESLSGISDRLQISAAITAMIVLSIGTAMPEIFGGAAVVRGRKSNLTLGNLFAATAADLLLVCGAAALLTPLVFGGTVLAVGLPFLAVAALLLTIAALSGRIDAGQGLLFLFVYFFFFVKILELF